MPFNRIRLQAFEFVDRCNRITQSLLHVFDLWAAFVRVLRVFHQVQGRFKNIGDVENWGVRHTYLHPGGQNVT